MSNSSNSDNNDLNWSVLGNSTCLSPDNPAAIWPYCPSEPAAIIFTVLFGLTVGAHIYFAAKYRKGFCWVIIMAAIWETAGYALRAVATQYQQALAFYFPQLLLTLLAPLLINAYVYMVFARLVQYFSVDQKVGGIRARRLSLIFVCLDVIAFLVQIGGASMLVGTDPNQLRLGKDLYMGGIGLQEFCILMFTGLVIAFDRRARHGNRFRDTDHRLSTMLVYVSLGLITVRIIYRLVEYSAGFDSAITRTETYQYVLDALPMWAVITVWAVLHPGKVLVGPESEFPKLTRQDKKRIKQEEKAAKSMLKEGNGVGMEPIRPQGPFVRLSPSPEPAYTNVNIERSPSPYRDYSPSR